MRWSVFTLLVLAIAGCTGEPSANGADGPAPVLDNLGQVITNATAANATALVLTDTLYLVPAARLNAGGLANVTILATLSGTLPQTYNWNATLNGTGNVSHARLLLWIDLQSSALQPGVNGDSGCTAYLTLVFTRNGTNTFQAGGCASAGRGTIAPGEYLLDFGTPMTAFPTGAVLNPGDKVLAQVAFGLSFPQGFGYVLGGGERPSGLRLSGLAEPTATS